MSLLGRIQPKQPKSILQQVLENLAEDGTLQNQIEQVLSHQEHSLSAMAQQQLQSNTVDFLMRDMNRHHDAVSLLNRMIAELGKELDPPTMGFTPVSFRRQAKPRFDLLLDEMNVNLAQSDIENLWEAVVSEFVGFGPLDALLLDDSITEIVALGERTIYVTKNEQRERLTQLVFTSNDHYARIIDRMFPHVDGGQDAPIESTKLADNIVAFCLFAGIDYVETYLLIHKYTQ